jgi:hypothetical protein
LILPGKPNTGLSRVRFRGSNKCQYNSETKKKLLGKADGGRKKKVEKEGNKKLLKLGRWHILLLNKRDKIKRNRKSRSRIFSIV